MKNADLTLIVAKRRTLISFLVHLTGDELSKKGRQKGVWVNYLLVWDWWFIMPEWNLSSLPGDSLIYQNQTQALTISRRSWKQGSDGLVLIKGWLVGTAGTPCCYSVEFHCGHLAFFFFRLRHNEQAVCNGRKVIGGDLWENSQPDSIIYTCKW